MDNNNQKKTAHLREEFETTIAKKVSRKLKSKQDKYRSIWYGLAMSGLVGWSVAIPTILGIMIGIWLDHHLRASYSCTLMGLFLGITLGCLNAWYWIDKETRRRGDRSDH